MTLIWLSDEERVIDLTSSIAASGTFTLPEPLPHPRLDAGVKGFEPSVPPRSYRRSFPRRYRSVIAEDVTFKAGTALVDVLPPCVDALIFERVGG